MANETCQACGTSLEPQAAYCRNCGAAVLKGGPGARAEGGTAPAFGSQASPSGPLGPDQTIRTESYAYAQMPLSAGEDTSPLSVGQYLLMLIISGIPMVGLIMQLVWAFGGATNVNRRNFARAGLILSLAAIVLAIIFSGLVIALVAIVRDNYSRF